MDIIQGPLRKRKFLCLMKYYSGVASFECGDAPLKRSKKHLQKVLFASFQKPSLSTNNRVYCRMYIFSVFIILLKILHTSSKGFPSGLCVNRFPGQADCVFPVKSMFTERAVLAVPFYVAYCNTVTNAHLFLKYVPNTSNEQKQKEFQ